VLELSSEATQREAGLRKAIFYLAVSEESEIAIHSLLASLRKDLGAEYCAIDIESAGEVRAYAVVPESAKIAPSDVAIPVVWEGQKIASVRIGRAKPVEPREEPRIQDATLMLGLILEHSRLRENEQRIASQGNLLLKATERIGTAMSVDDVISAYLDQVASNGRYYCTIVLYEFDELGNKIGNVVRGRWSPGGDVLLVNHKVATKRDFFDPMLAEGKTIKIANALIDAEIPKSLREEQQRDRRPAVALIPLMSEGVRIGLVILSDSNPHEWSDEELLPFQATANQLAAALASRRDHDARIEADRKLAVLDERRKIARDLHDSVTQILFSLNLLAQTLEPETAPPAELVERINQLSRRGLQEMRSLLEELRPVQPESPSLPQQISAYVSTLVGLREFVLDSSDYQGSPPNVEAQLLRIAQEGLNNVVKHSGAQLTKVTLQSVGIKVKLSIEDDGIGLTKEQMEKGKQGLGLGTMRERAREIRAEFNITSRSGNGTKIEVLWQGEGS
jgi:signal transduction histidine kinase